MKKILGISAFYHDSAAALVINGEIIAAAQEERFTRIKHTPDFPKNAISYCLNEAGINIDDLDAIIFYDKPLLKFERLLQTYYAFAPKGLVSFIKSIPLWLKEKLFLRKIIYDGLKEIQDFDKKNIKLLFSEHHLSHAASAFFPSSFNNSAILTIDGVGEWCTTAIAKGEGNKIQFLKELEFPHSVGLLYSAFTYYLGFTVNSGEYKMMGLAPYGNRISLETKQYIDTIKEILIDIKEDGSIWLNQSYFNYSIGLTMVKSDKWNKLFKIKKREENDEITQSHCNLALAIQLVTEEIILKLAKEAKRLTKSDNLCLAGGVALNCVANGILLQSKLFKEIYIQPASGDAGGALGAALASHYIYYDNKRDINWNYDTMKGSYLGPSFSNKEISFMNKKNKAVTTYYENFDTLTKFISSRLAEGKVVGWFQDKMEFGPRALGNRSIIADPRAPDMQKKLNLSIKQREGFRPFAPSVLLEDLKEYFEINSESPYMLFVSPVNVSRRNALPENFDTLTLLEKLYIPRSDIPAITHLDFSARVQTVDKNINLKFWKLISQFKTNTGYGILVNTSFNVRGEPIVCTPFDAYRCFMSTDIDYLVINNFVYCKTDQNNWQNKENWILKFKKD